jgi:cell division protein FtsL
MKLLLLLLLLVVAPGCVTIGYQTRIAKHDVTVVTNFEKIAVVAIDKRCE